MSAMQMSMPMPRRSSRWGVPLRRGVVVLLLAGLSSCGSSGKAAGPSGVGGSAGGGVPASADAEDTTSPDAFLFVDRARSGLEVQWWVADDTDGAVGAVLYEVADGAAPLPPERARALIDNGLRVVRVRLDRLGELQRRLPTVRTLERTWFGSILDWKPLFTGLRLDPPPGGGQPVVMVDGVPERMPVGVLRIIGRSWVASSASGEVLRFEAVPQLRTSVRDEAVAALGLKNTGPATVPEEGRLFTMMAVSTALERGFVYVIAPESPGVEWKDAKARAREAGSSPAGGVAGPEITPPPTVGEAMMTVRPAADRPGQRPLKAVVVLVPR